MRGKESRGRRWVVAVTGIAVLAGQGACGGEADRVEPDVLPAGTTMAVSLDQPLTTRVNRAGDTFDATLTEPVRQDGRTVLAAGTPLKGRIQRALAAGEPGGPLLALEITRAVPSTAPSFSIETAPVSIERAAPTAAPLEASIGTGAEGMLSGDTPPEGSDAGGSRNEASAEIEVSAGREFQVSILRAVEIGTTAGY